MRVGFVVSLKHLNYSVINCISLNHIFYKHISNKNLKKPYNHLSLQTSEEMTKFYISLTLILVENLFRRFIRKIFDFFSLHLIFTKQFFLM